MVEKSTEIVQKWRTSILRLGDWQEVRNNQICFPCSWTLFIHLFMLLFFLTFLLHLRLQMGAGTRARYLCLIQEGQSHEVWNRHICLLDMVFPGCSLLPNAGGTGTYGQPCTVAPVLSLQWSFWTLKGCMYPLKCFASLFPCLNKLVL